MDRKELIEKIKKDGISFDQFNEQADMSIIDVDDSIMDELDRKKLSYTKLNQSRTYRILKTYKMSDEIKKAISEVTEPQTWMVLTEDWCGDSAQNLPYVYKIIQLNENIDFKFLYRDDHLDIMDEYLTNGGRAIPKLVAFDKDGNELFEWGPRPEEAKKLVKQWKSEGDTTEQFNEKLHLWYGKNRGKALEKELLELIRRK